METKRDELRLGPVELKLGQQYFLTKNVCPLFFSLFVVQIVKEDRDRNWKMRWNVSEIPNKSPFSPRKPYITDVHKAFKQPSPTW